jgi:hypothetical protein
MKRYLLLIGLLLLVALPAQAQTATPTISPHVHYQGYYTAFREYNAGRLTISGTWAVPAAGYETILQTTQIGAWAALTVSDSICTIGVIHSTTSTLVTFYINNVSVLSLNGNTPGVGYTAVVDTSSATADFQFKVQMVNGGTLNVFQFHLIECGDAYPLSPTPFVPVPTATAINTSTPAPTWTHAPYMTVVPTATILPSSTPGVPTATILPSSTPGGPTPTQINTPVDTATAIVFPPTPTEIDISTILTALAMPTNTPGPTATPTNTPTETLTPTAEPWAYITLTSGQLTRFDYVATASDVHISNLLLLIFVSVWGFFLTGVFVVWKAKKK